MCPGTSGNAPQNILFWCLQNRRKSAHRKNEILVLFCAMSATQGNPLKIIWSTQNVFHYSPKHCLMKEKQSSQLTISFSREFLLKVLIIAFLSPGASWLSDIATDSKNEEVGFPVSGSAKAT